MISLIGTYEPILQYIRRRKLKWYTIVYGHTIRHETSENQSSQVWLRIIAYVVDPKENGLMISNKGAR